MTTAVHWEAIADYYAEANNPKVSQQSESEPPVGPREATDPFVKGLPGLP